LEKQEDTYVFKNMHKAQTQDNFCDGNGKTQTLAAVSTRATSTKGAEYLRAIQLDGKYVRKKNFVFICYSQLY